MNNKFIYVLGISFTLIGGTTLSWARGGCSVSSHSCGGEHSFSSSHVSVSRVTSTKISSVKITPKVARVSPKIQTERVTVIKRTIIQSHPIVEYHYTTSPFWWWFWLYQHNRYENEKKKEQINKSW